MALYEVEVKAPEDSALGKQPKEGGRRALWAGQKCSSSIEIPPRPESLAPAECGPRTLKSRSARPMASDEQTSRGSRPSI